MVKSLALPAVLQPYRRLQPYAAIYTDLTIPLLQVSHDASMKPEPGTIVKINSPGSNWHGVTTVVANRGNSHSSMILLFIPGYGTVPFLETELEVLPVSQNGYFDFTASSEAPAVSGE
jgi:hypothetical protein